MKYVKQMEIIPFMSVGQLVNEMDECGVLGAGRLAKGVNIMVDMFSRPEFTVFLTLAGPMVLGGLRKIICDLIEDKYIDVIISSGANIVHDLMEALGHRGVRGSLSINDLKLRERGLGRVGDIYIEQKGFEKLEQKIYAVLDDLPVVKKNRLSQVELLNELGKAVDDNESILNKASTHNIPIFSPGLLDSMLGLHLWTYSQLKKISIDPLLDLNELSNLIYNSTKSGAIILGGGLPKHHVLGANILRDGVDAAVQITLDRPEGGSQSGAPLEEAISWKKVQSKEGTVTIIGDVIIIFPIMVAATVERLKEKDKQNLLTSAL